MFATYNEIKAALENYDKNNAERMGIAYEPNAITITDHFGYEMDDHSGRAYLIHCEDEAGDEFAAIAYPEGEIAVMSDWQAGSRPVSSDEIADYDWVGVNF